MINLMVEFKYKVILLV